MLFAGRFIDRIGTKPAFLIAIAIWSFGAIMHAFALFFGDAVNSLATLLGLSVVPASIVGFMLSRAVLALGEAGNLPAAIKATAEYFPGKRTLFATGIFFNSGANIGAVLAPITVFDCRCLGLANDLHHHRRDRFYLDGILVVFYDKPEQQKRLSAEELAYINQDQADANNANTVEESGGFSWFRLLAFHKRGLRFW